MMTLGNDSELPLPTVESIKAWLVDAVATAARGRSSQVHVTVIGGQFFKRTGETFENYLHRLAIIGEIHVPVPRRKLVPFLTYYCADKIAVQKLETGAWVVSSIDAGSEPDIAPSNVPQRATLTFRRGVWAAFIRVLSPGMKRFLNLDSIGFTDAETAPVEGAWKEIQRERILGAHRDDSIDGADIQRRIEQWAVDMEVPVSTLVLPPPPLSGRQLDALLDIIDALPAAVAATWSIPAMVLKNLRHAR